MGRVSQGIEYIFSKIRAEIFPTIEEINANPDIEHQTAPNKTSCKDTDESEQNPSE